MTSRRAAEKPEAIVIWNGSAGSTNKAGDLRLDLETRQGVQLIETASRDETIRLAEKACREGIPRVIAAGGDGTINAVVSALVDCQRRQGDSATLAVLPLGTGNDLARSLKMPFDPTEAIHVCLTGRTALIDVMELDCGEGPINIAANMVTAGNTGKYIEVLTDELKQRWGALCYLRGTVDILEELEVFGIKLAIDDEPPIDVQALNLFFANGRTSGGGMTVCADACLNDGQLDLLVIRDGTGLDLATLTVDYPRGRLRAVDDSVVRGRRSRESEPVHSHDQTRRDPGCRRRIKKAVAFPRNAAAIEVGLSSCACRSTEVF
jgi:diacylglycerol kinase (ATP)